MPSRSGPDAGAGHNLDNRRKRLVVHVWSRDPKDGQMSLTTHCLLVFVALDEQRQPTAVPRWEPVTEEDRALEQHALHLMELRRRANLGVNMQPRAG
jgi:acyl-CoA hydrolase